MMAHELKLLNDFFHAQEGVQLIQPLRPITGGGAYALEGKIQVMKEHELFVFQVRVPSNFPMYGLDFLYEGDRVARHLLRKGRVCVASPFTASFIDKVEADLNALKEWIVSYALKPHGDHYEYLPLERAATFLLFDEEPQEAWPPEGETGEFLLTPVPGQAKFGFVEHTFLANGLGGRTATWSRFQHDFQYLLAQRHLEEILLLGLAEGRFTLQQIAAFNFAKTGNQWPSEVNKPQFTPEEQRSLEWMSMPRKGVYLVLPEEPIRADKRPIESMEELFDLLPAATLGILENAQQEPSFSKALLGGIPLALGYLLPSDSAQREMHWEWLILPLTDMGIAWDEGKIRWGSSVNISKPRFFGRGGILAPSQHQKVLIIGLGAIGSSLAETLVRGGFAHLTIADFDYVEAGNVCRSTYTLSSIHRTKAEMLLVKLLTISPFVEVGTIADGFHPMLRHHRSFSDTKVKFQSFDLIFDCTADDAVAYTLDQMKLRATIVNLTITDEARQLLAVTNRGGEAILPQKNRILQSLQGDQPTANGPTFYEGTGCWHPTFRASFSDINLLLQHFLVGANRRLEQGHGWATTVLERLDGDYGIRVVQREDV